MATLRNELHAPNSGNVAQAAFPFGFTPVAGDLLVVTGSVNQGSASGLAVVEAGWAPLTLIADGTAVTARQWWKVAAGTETTVTLQRDGVATGAFACDVLDFAPAAGATWAFHAESTPKAAGANVTTLSSNPLVTSVGSCVAVGGVATVGTPALTSFTGGTVEATGTLGRGITGYNLAVGAGSVTWTVAWTPTNRAVFVLAAWSETVAAGPVGRSSDVRWAVRGVVARGADVRWALRAVTGRGADVRWAVRGRAGRSADLRWAVAGPTAAVGRSADVRWALRSPAGRAADLRWSVLAVGGGGPSGPTLSEWVVAVGPWRSTPSRALRTAHQRRLTLRVDDSAGFSFTLDGRGGDAAAIDVLETDVWVYRDRVLMFRGRVVAAPETVDADRHVVSVAAIDYRGLLSRRYLQTDQTYSQWGQGDIAWDLITQTQHQPGGDLGITFGTVPSGVLRDRTYIAGDNLGERLAELGRVDGGFEWWIDAQRRLQLVEGTRGDVTPVVLDYGGSVASVRREPDVNGFANQVTVTGGEGTVAARAVASDVATDVRGRWERTFSYPSVVEQATLASKASNLLAHGQRPPLLYTVRLAPGAWGRSAPITIGDTAWLRLVSGQRSERVQVRVDELTVTVGDSGEEAVEASCVASSVALGLTA